MAHLTIKAALLLITTAHYITQTMDAPIAQKKSLHEMIKESAIALDSLNIRKLAWSPDGNYIAGIQTCRPIHSVDVCNPTGKKLFVHEYLFDSIDSIAFSPDSTKIAVTGFIQEPAFHGLKIIEVSDKRLFCSDNFKDTPCFAYNNTGTRIALAGKQANWPFESENVLQIIDTQTGKVIKQLEEGPIFALAYSPSGNLLAMSCWRDGNSWIDFLNTQQYWPMGSLNHGTETIDSLQFYHNASKIISCSRTRCLLWDLNTSQILRQFTKGFDSDPHAEESYLHFTDIALSKDDKKLIAAQSGIEPLSQGPYYFVTIFNTEAGTGEITAEFEKKRVKAIACSPDMKKIAVAKWLYTHIITLPSDEEIEALQQHVNQ
jgi:WD40 repeat protein